MKKEIYLIRHGETDFNRKGIVQGRGVNSSLNETGKKQAQAFHQYFRHIEFDFLFSSSLLRTQQTLEPFRLEGYPLNITETLDEINWGIHEGKTSDKETHHQYKDLIRLWSEGKVDEKIPEGESPIELQKRQLIFLNEILPKYHGKVLICSHGRAIRSLLCTMLGRPLSEMDTFPHTNLSLYQLMHQEENFTLQLHNYTVHLQSI